MYAPAIRIQRAGMSTPERDTPFTSAAQSTLLDGNGRDDNTITTTSRPQCGGSKDFEFNHE